MTQKRYDICKITDSECIATSIGDVLYSTDDAADAKASARQLASAEYWGTVIVDRQAHTADFGTDVDGNRLLADVPARILDMLTQ